MMEKLREETISNIRAVLISVKGKCEINQLKRDYRGLMGSEIPFRNLGCASLEDLMRQIPTLMVTRSNGQTFVDAKATAKTAHIVEMVQRQKAAKKRPPKFSKRTTYNTNNYHNYRKSQWQPKNQDTSRAHAMHHNQINIPRNRPQITHQQPCSPFTRKSPLIPINNNTIFNNAPITPKSFDKIPPPTPLMAIDLREKLNAKTITPIDLRGKLNSKTIPRHQIDDKLTNGVNKIALNNLNATKSTKNLDVSFESDSSNSGDKVPHSIKTNRASLMPNILNKSVLSMDSLQKEAFAAVDTSNAIWTAWTSSDTDGSDSGYKATGDAVIDLQSFARHKRLGAPVYKIVTREGNKRTKLLIHDCYVKVGNLSASSYPKDFHEEALAKADAAAQVLVLLQSKYDRRLSSTLCSMQQEVLERIPQMVEKHFHGIWSWQLEADYKDAYGEQLPANWKAIVDTSPWISVENFGNKHVLRYCNPEDKGKNSIATPLNYDVSIPSSTVQFDESGYMTAEITCVVSAEEIWCKQLDTVESDAYNAMLKNLAKHYSVAQNAQAATQVHERCYYAARIEGALFRVRVLEVFATEAQCLLVDRGDDQTVALTHIYPLPREFAKEMSQAFICRLAGLDDFYEISAGSENLANLEGMTVYLQNCIVDDIENDKSDTINVIMYDIATNINMNLDLINLLSIESAKPCLHDKTANEVLVSHIESNGDIYVQVPTPGFDKLENLLLDLEASVIEHAPSAPEPVTRTNCVGRLYFAQFHKDKHWYRMRIIDWSPNSQFAQIYFVDYGNTQVVRMSETVLYPLATLSPIIAQFPEQAVKVRMFIERVPADFEQIVQKLMPDGSDVLLRIVQRDADGVPCVIFCRRVPDVGLLNVNEMISNELEAQTANSSAPQNTKDKLDILLRSPNGDHITKGNVPSTGNLKCPPLPEVGSDFDVKIPFAVNPWNFFVQPYDSHDKLTKLMTELQSRYAEIEFSPLQIDDIQPGNIYASKYVDGIWYRTSVIKIIHPGCISVFYCDFGYYLTVTLQQLIPLDPHLLELPFQAIKAKLSGIKPRQTKWSMDDCKYFERQVLRKTFVSVLTLIESDELYPSDTVLNLMLIDTSTDKDVYIEELLVKKDIAVKV